MAPNFEVNNFKLIGDDITTAFNDAEKKKKKKDLTIACQMPCGDRN